MSDDLLAAAASFGLVVIFLTSCAFKYATLIDSEDFYAKMSPNQRSVYVLSYTKLTAIVMVAVVGALLVSVAIFMVQLAAEAARQHREARTNRARRLRYVSNDKEVVVPRIDDGQYHLFLSHGEGRRRCNIAQRRAHCTTLQHVHVL
eukprot:3059649-Prymnesium_polylepis.1